MNHSVSLNVYRSTHSWYWRCLSMPTCIKSLQFVFQFSSDTCYMRGAQSQNVDPLSNPPPSLFLCWTGENPGLRVPGVSVSHLATHSRSFLLLIVGLSCFLPSFLASRSGFLSAVFLPASAKSSQSSPAGFSCCQHSVSATSFGLPNWLFSCCWGR